MEIWLKRISITDMDSLIWHNKKQNKSRNWLKNNDAFVRILSYFISIFFIIPKYFCESSLLTNCFSSMWLSAEEVEKKKKKNNDNQIARSKQSENLERILYPLSCLIMSIWVRWVKFEDSGKHRRVWTEWFEAASFLSHVKIFVCIWIHYLPW